MGLAAWHVECLWHNIWLGNISHPTRNETETVRAGETTGLAVVVADARKVYAGGP